MKTIYHIINTTEIVNISCVIAVIIVDIAAISLWLMNHIQLEEINKIIN